VQGATISFYLREMSALEQMETCSEGVLEHMVCMLDVLCSTSIVRQMGVLKQEQVGCVHRWDLCLCVCVRVCLCGVYANSLYVRDVR
jgi:hypothetical protein